MFKKKPNKQGVSLDDVINRGKSLLPEHRERPWVVQWMFFTVLFLCLVLIKTVYDFYK